MSAADDANRRLEAALARLEAVLTTHGAATDRAAAQEAERTRLEREMAAVQNDFAKLRRTSTEVSQRLDAAIGTIKGILAE